MAERVHRELAVAFTLDGQEVFIGASIGIALGGADAPRAEVLLRDADLAMYRAKAQGRTRYVVADASLHAQAVARLRLESDLRRALERAQLVLHYQPIVALTTGELVGVEALARWEHPERGLVAPGEFIPLAEETGLIVPLGAWALGEACRQLRAWDERFPASRALTMSVNLAARQFAQPDLVEHVDRVLRETGLAAPRLQLELTEGAIIEDPVANSAVLARLRALGVRVAVDDFGTGYCSLTYLRQFPLDALKVDRSFVGRMGETGPDWELVRMIVALAHMLGLSVVAEGVETTRHLAQLRELGCEAGQGYYFARPLAADAMAALLASPWPAYGRRGAAAAAPVAPAR